MSSDFIGVKGVFRMTAKRFTINDCRVLSNEQVFKILNQLTDENEQLKKENMELKLIIEQDEFAKEEGFK